MKFRLLLSCIAGLLGSVAVSVQADTQLAHVTNNVVDSGSCTISGVNGGYGWMSNKLTCGADVIYVTNKSGVGGTCILDVSPGYYISGGCSSAYVNSYTLYKTTTTSSSPASSSSSSSSAPAMVHLTDVTNGNQASNPECRAESVGGYTAYNYSLVGYRITCGSTMIGVTFTTSYGYCSLTGASGGYTFVGGCGFYSIYKN